jgi:hypothetical protein
LPVGLGVVLVAVVLLCVDLVGEELLVGDAPIQTLRREHAEFGFGNVEPTAVLRLSKHWACSATRSAGLGHLYKGGVCDRHGRSLAPIWVIAFSATEARK